ncbi:MAG: hypothetical protein L3J08_00720 [Flavobacteriaceae bacterium]|nr:hypothetical protein [Flavobacteriaceae bacterium]
MKIMYKKLLLLLFIPLVGMATPNPKEGKYKKSKTINKEYRVNANALLKISNKYGNVDVISWNENRVVIEVKITVNGDNQDKVISRLESINVNFEANNSMVYAKTLIEKLSSSWFNWNNSNINYQIDYKVKIPITNNVYLINDYGTISLNELKGKAKINCDYGKIIIGDLLHSDNNINMDYTKNSTIEFMNDGQINADYSSLTIGKAKNINLSADYSTIVFENIEGLKFNCDYGKVQVDNGNHIIGNGDYLSMRFGKIHKTLKINNDYGNIHVEKLMKGFKNVDIYTDYTRIKIGLDSSASFNFTVKLNYARFNLDGNNVNYTKKIIKNTSKYYEGYVNQDNSGATVKIVSEYGSVKFYNN